MKAESIGNVPLQNNKVLSRNVASRRNPVVKGANVGGNNFAIVEEAHSSKFSLFEDSCDSAAPKFEFEKQMLLQL